MHYIDVLDELCQERLHTLCCRSKLHNLVQGSIDLSLCDLPVDLEVFLEALKGGGRVKVLGMKPIQLLVDVLLWEDKDIEFF